MSKKIQRMKDTMKASDLNDEAVIELAATILSGLARDLEMAARRAAAYPSKDNLHHLEVIRNIYSSEWFHTLSLGTVNGPEAAQSIIKRTLRGRNLPI